MKKLVKQLRTESSGFTLVELLVVIVIIGILAVAVLAAINPIEQIRRGRDTARQAAARELLSALERYYGVRGDFPWLAAGDPSGAQITATAWTTTYDLDLLVTENELKPGFENRSPVANGELYLTEDANSNIHVCFDPESDAFQDRADCSSAAPVGDGSVCDGTVADDEYFCIPDSTQ